MGFRTKRNLFTEAQIKSFFDIKNPNSFIVVILEALNRSYFFKTIDKAHENKQDFCLATNNWMLQNLIRTGYIYSQIITIRRLLDNSNDVISLKSILESLKYVQTFPQDIRDELLNELKSSVILKELRKQCNKFYAHLDIEYFEKNPDYKLTELTDALVILAKIIFKIKLHLFDSHQVFETIRPPNIFKYLDKPFFLPEEIKDLENYYKFLEKAFSKEIESSNL